MSDTLQKVSLEALGFVSLCVDTLIGKVILLGILGNKKIICTTHFSPIRQVALMSVTKYLEERCLYETLAPYVVGYHQRSNPSTSQISPSVLFPAPSGSVPYKLSPLLTKPFRFEASLIYLFFLLKPCLNFFFFSFLLSFWEGMGRRRIV